MKKSKFSEEQIAAAVRQVDAGAPDPGGDPSPRDQRSDILYLAQTLRPDGRGRDPTVTAAGGRKPEIETVGGRSDA